MHLCGQFLHMCAMLQLHMWAGCVQAHAPKILPWCSATIGKKIRRKARHSRTYLIHKMCSVLFVFFHPLKCSQCSCTYVVSFFTCAMLHLHMWAGCVQAHAPKIFSWCSGTLGEKIRRKTRHSRTYLIHKMCSVLFFFPHPPKCCQCSCTYVGSFFTCVRCCSYICGQDVSRRMRPRYFPDAVLQ